MGFRLWRRVNLIPGLRLNLSKSGPSISLGHRGAWFTFGPRGKRLTVGGLGTGMFYTKTIGAPPSKAHRTNFLLVMLLLALVALAMF